MKYFRIFLRSTRLCFSSFFLPGMKISASVYVGLPQQICSYHSTCKTICTALIRTKRSARKTRECVNSFITTSHLSPLSGRKKQDQVATRIRVVSYLEQNLKLTTAEATLTLSVHPKLKNIQFEELSSTIDFLIKNNFSLQLLKDNPWVLCHPMETIKTNFKLLESSFGKVCPGQLFLLVQKTKVLQSIILNLENEKSKKIDRVDYLVKELDCTEIELNQLLYRHCRVLLMEFQRLKDIMKLLKSNRIATDIIRRDMWIFRNNQPLMEERLLRLKDASLTPIHTWMLRCSEDVFSRCLNKWQQRQEAVQPYTDIVGYLAKRLNKSHEFIRDEFIKKNPVLLRVNPPKVKQVLDFLFEKGFTPEQVMASPRVFQMSVLSLKYRLEKLNELGYLPKTLNILSIQWKDFHEHVNKIKHNKSLFSKIIEKKHL